jgi:hypothetical protein
MTKEEEPDFFDLEQSSPLPTLEQAKVQLERRKMGRIREHFEKDTAVKSIPDYPSRTPAQQGAAEIHHIEDVQAKRNALKQADLIREQEYSQNQALKAIQMHEIAHVQANQAARAKAVSDQELDLRAREVLHRERELQVRLQQQTQLDLQHRSGHDLKDRLDRMDRTQPNMRSLADADLKGYELDPRASAMRQVQTEALLMRHHQEQYLASQHQQRLMLHHAAAAAASSEIPHERFLLEAQAIRRAELFRDEEEQQLVAAQSSAHHHLIGANPFMRQAQVARQLEKMHASQNLAAAAAAMGGYASSVTASPYGGGPMSPFNPLGNPYL